MFPMREQDKIPEELNEVEIGNLPDNDHKDVQRTWWKIK